jgi:hypothetical protein
MNNFDFVSHLAETASALDASVELVESFFRSYYRDMHAVIAKWSGAGIRDDQFQRAFSEVNAVHQKYWLPQTRFIEYWQPSLGSPNEYSIVDLVRQLAKLQHSFSDMLGNFVVNVNTPEGTSVYLLSVVRDELKIINKFFR